MKNLISKDDLIQQYAEQAEKATAAANDFRQRTMFDMAQKIEDIKNTRKAKDDEQRIAMEEEVRKLEEQLEREREAEALREAEKEADLDSDRKRRKQEKDEAEKLAILQKEVGDNEKERLMKEHQDNMAKFEDNLKKEQNRTKEMLRKKLEERRKKKKSLEMGKIRDEFQVEVKEAAQEERERLAALQKEGAKVLTSATPSLGAKQIREKEEAPEQDALQQSEAPMQSVFADSAAGIPVAAMSDQDWMRVLAGSPLFKAVNDIEEMIKDGVGPQGVIGAKGRPYIDIKDAQWTCQGDLTPVDINELNPMQFVVYRFGVFITQLLQDIMDVPEVTLLVASSLPPNNYSKNAFRNSFFYERSRRILFVRQERMDSVGDFVVLLMHCLAHIKVDDLADDNNVLFLREFYKAMRVCCQDMFFSRSRSTPTTALLTDIPSQNRMLGTPLEQAFKVMKKPSHKLNVVKELVDVKVNDPISQDFTSEGVTERISKYNTFVDNAKLRAYLRSVGAIDTSEQSESFAQTRLKELTGKQSKSAETPLRRMTSSRMSVLSPSQLLDNQINELNSRIDNLNSELTTILKSTSDIAKNIKNLEASGTSPEILQRRRKQWEEHEFRKNNVMKKLKLLEAEIARKEKERAT